MKNKKQYKIHHLYYVPYEAVMLYCREYEFLLAKKSFFLIVRQLHIMVFNIIKIGYEFSSARK